MSAAVSEVGKADQLTMVEIWMERRVRVNSQVLSCALDHPDFLGPEHAEPVCVC